MIAPGHKLRRIVREIDLRWTLQRVQPHGGRAWTLFVSSGGAHDERLILLTHSEGDRLRNPHIARDEYRLLRALASTGLPAPEALYLCPSNDPPFLISSFAAGAAGVPAERPAAVCRALADCLYAIHAVDLRQHDLEFLPDVGEIMSSDRLPRSAADFKLEAAMKSAAPRIAFNAPALLHGDFWPGNLLWRGGDVSAIIDWEDAMLGDPLADLGKSRLEVLWALGREAMTEYTTRYLALNRGLDAKWLPYWDLWGARRLAHFAAFAPVQTVIPRMRAQYEAFAADAIRRLSAI